MQLKQQISNDLHDEVGSNLAGISLICQSLLEFDHQRADQKTILRKALEISKETSEGMRDIVWMLHPDRKGKIVLQDYLKDVMNRLLRNCVTEFNPLNADVLNDLSLDQQRDFIFFYRETLHNIQKHSQASIVEISFEKTTTMFTLIIEDDGIDVTSFHLPKSLDQRIKK